MDHPRCRSSVTTRAGFGPTAPANRRCACMRTDAWCDPTPGWCAKAARAPAGLTGPTESCWARVASAGSDEGRESGQPYRHHRGGSGIGSDITDPAVPVIDMEMQIEFPPVARL